MNLGFLAMGFGALALREHGKHRMLLTQLMGVISSSSLFMGVAVGAMARMGAPMDH